MMLALQSSIEDQDNDNVTFSCVNLYFMCQDGSTFKAQFKFAPYFYIGTKENTELEVDAYLRRRYEGQIANIQVVSKEDLGLKNHLSGLQHSYLKVSFNTVQELMNVKSELLPIVDRNRAKLDAAQAYESLLQGMTSTKQATGKIQDYVDFILEMREYDVPYHVRFAIDNDIRCGLWYMVSMEASQTRLERRTDLLQRAEVRVCAFDIETTKLPLKFPDASYDSVMMISYMIDGQGYLIINRECVGQDIEDLEYTPKPEFEGHFKVTNVTQEVMSFAITAQDGC
jgi:DNA polymerase epsilon subunit 1